MKKSTIEMGYLKIENQDKAIKSLNEIINNYQ